MSGGNFCGGSGENACPSYNEATCPSSSDSCKVEDKNKESNIAAYLGAVGLLVTMVAVTVARVFFAHGH